MAFQKVLTLNLETTTAQKMTEYVDLFIRGCQVDPTPMTTPQKETFIKNYFFQVLKNTIKNQSDVEKKLAVVLEDVGSVITNS